MAKIDCSVTVNFLREKKRMCDSYMDGCGTCALREVSKYTEYSCSSYLFNFPGDAIEIVQKWSDEHPAKTRLMDIRVKYPNIPMEDGTPVVAPWVLGYCRECSMCSKADKITPDCWNEPVDGGATGKAAEK